MKANRRPRWKRLKWLVLVTLLLVAYPGFVFATVYAHWFVANLPGGRNGPGDAYRHALASATVAYTGSPRWVEWVTAVMEHGGEGNDSRAMDAHNNRIGARIGVQASSWRQMQADVMAAIERGTVNTADEQQITWLPPERWQNRLY